MTTFTCAENQGTRRSFYKLSTLALTGVAFALAMGHASATTLSLSGLSGDISNGDWSTHTYGSLTLAPGTNAITNLQSTVTVYDQGWGGEAPSWTQVFLGVYDNSALIWSSFVAGGGHFTFDPQYFTADASQLAALNLALAGVSSSDTITVNLQGNIQAYPGWAEHVRDSSYTITSSVSESGSIGLLGLGLAGLGFSRRKKQDIAA